MSVCCLPYLASLLLYLVLSAFFPPFLWRNLSVVNHEDYGHVCLVCLLFMSV